MDFSQFLNFDALAGASTGVDDLRPVFTDEPGRRNSTPDTDSGDERALATPLDAMLSLPASGSVEYAKAFSPLPAADSSLFGNEADLQSFLASMGIVPPTAAAGAPAAAAPLSEAFAVPQPSFEFGAAFRGPSLSPAPSSPTSIAPELVLHSNNAASVSVSPASFILPQFSPAESFASVPPTPAVPNLALPSSSPAATAAAPPGTVVRRRKPHVKLDDPVQQRKYVTASATSKKAIPACAARIVEGARKRKRSTSAGDEAEAGEPERKVQALAADGTVVELSSEDQAKIDAKRKQNTDAARRSRWKKAKELEDLNTALEEAVKEREMWKERAVALGWVGV